LPSHYTNSASPKRSASGTSAIYTRRGAVSLLVQAREREAHPQPGFGLLYSCQWIGGDLRFSVSCGRESLLSRFPADGFCAVYHKPTTQPQLILKRRTQTDDYVVLARAWQAANDKTRELGWIV
jgi:hypothetical protein